MPKKVLTDYHKQFIAENYKQLGCYPYCTTLVVICG